jgi:hypothetical protein
MTHFTLARSEITTLPLVKIPNKSALLCHPLHYPKEKKFK